MKEWGNYYSNYLLQRKDSAFSTTGFKTNFDIISPSFPRPSSEPCTEPCYSMYFLQSYSSLCLVSSLYSCKSVIFQICLHIRIIWDGLKKYRCLGPIPQRFRFNYPCLFLEIMCFNMKCQLVLGEQSFLFLSNVWITFV